jgi:hypothetical protein
MIKSFYFNKKRLHNHNKEVVHIFAVPLIFVRETRISGTKVGLHMAIDKDILQVYKDEIAIKSVICSFTGCSGENKRYVIRLSPAVTIQVETCIDSSRD